jgi:hypothetical protein
MEFPLTDALIEPLRFELQKEYTKEYDKKFEEAKKALELEERTRAQEDTALMIKDLEEQVKEKALG